MDLEAHLASFLATMTGLAQGDVAVVAVSGGVDSVALAAALARAAQEAGVRLHLAHLDHGWRPSRAAAAVTELAATLRLPFTVARLAAGSAVTEGTAREARRAFLRHVAALVEAPAIFLAHHADDQAETVLMHLAQGAGARGGRGMAPQAEALFRPLLDVPKAALISYVVKRQLPFEEDPTNADTTHVRNFLRRDVLPEVARRLPGAPGALRRHARHLEADEAHFQKLVAAIFDDRSLQLGPGTWLSLTAAERADGALLGRLALEILLLQGRRPTAGQVTALARALERGQGGGGRHLGVFPSGDGVYVGPDALLPEISPVKVEAGSLLVVPAPLAPHLRRTAFRLAGHGPWTVRSWRAGDVLAGGRTKVKEVLQKERIPRPFRSRVPIVEDAQGIVAAVAGLTNKDLGDVSCAFDPASRRLVVGVPWSVLE